MQTLLKSPNNLQQNTQIPTKYILKKSHAL